MSMNNVNGVNQQTQILATKLVETGKCTPEEVQGKNAEQLFNLAKEKGLQGLVLEQGTEIDPELAKIQREGEAAAKILDQNFVNAAKAYGEADAKYQALMAKEKLVRAALNVALEKTTKKNLEYGGKELPKQEVRTKLQKDLVDIRDELKAAKAALDEAREKLDDKEHGRDWLGKANRLNTDEAEKAYQAIKDDKNASEADKLAARKRAAMAAQREVNDYFNSEQGKAKATEANRQVARGNADHKLNHRERAARAAEVSSQLTQMLDEEGKPLEKGNPGNPDNVAAPDHKGKQWQKVAEKDYQRQLKQQALDTVIIGDANKKDYEAAKKTAGFKTKDGYPTVTYMDDKTFKAAEEYCASKGIELKTEENKDGVKVLTKDSMREFQQAMADAAGDFGSRADLNERRDIADNYQDISFKQARRMIEAANVDVQKDYRNAATAAGVGTSILVATALGAVDVIPGIAQQIIPGGGKRIYVPGANGETGHYIVEDLIIKGTDGKLQFHVGPAALALGAGALVAGLIMLANTDSNLLKKGKTLEDVVYNTLGNVEEFKKCKPSEKKIMAKFIANPDLTQGQKLAILKKAMGTEGYKLNVHELVAAANQANAFERPEGDNPTVERKVDIFQRKVYDIGDGKYVDENGNDVDMTGAQYIDEEAKAVTDRDAKAVGSRGTAFDTKIWGIDKNNTALRAETTKVDENGDLTDYNRKTARSQYTSADKQGDVRILSDKEDEKPNPLKPKIIEMDSYENYHKEDGTRTGEHNTYRYELITKAEAEAAGVTEDGTFYKLVSATNPNGESIMKSEGKIFKLTVDEKDRGMTYQSESDDQGLKSKTFTDTVQLNYHLDAVGGAKAKRGKSSPHYSETGATPDGVKSSATRTSTKASGTGTPAASGNYKLKANDTPWKVAQDALKAAGKPATKANIEAALDKIAKDNGFASRQEMAQKVFMQGKVKTLNINLE